MKKLRWLKKWQNREIGDISNVAESSAENFVNQGYAEYVEEEQKTKRDKEIETSFIKAEEEAKKPKKEKKAKKQKKKKKAKSESEESDDEAIRTSLHIDEENQVICEQVKTNEGNQFCIFYKKLNHVGYADFYLMDGVIYKPIIDEEVEKNAILLPSKAEDYISDEMLDNEIKQFIYKWLDVNADIIQFAVWNIKRSWVFERFHTLNYMRALGDTGQGKSRYLDTLGSIHYKPIATSGATTSAPIFRIINKWKGTLIIDEADFGKSDETNDIIKIINQGYEKGKYIMRCDQFKPDKIQFFDPFCPKVIATRKPFDDKATESRCITNVMMGTNRDDIPYNINNEFWRDALNLRNKLLMWRFRNYFDIDPEKKIVFDFGELEPRLKQIVSSLVSLFCNDEEQFKKFKTYILNKQEELIDERRSSFAGQIVEAIYDLTKSGMMYIDNKDVIEKAGFVDRNGHHMAPKALSKYLKELGFDKNEKRTVNNVAKRLIRLDNNHLNMLYKRYGLYDENEKDEKDNKDNKDEYTDRTKNEKNQNHSQTLISTGTQINGGGSPLDSSFSSIASFSSLPKIHKNAYKMHLPCHFCGLKGPGWEWETDDGKAICDFCAGKDN